MNPKHCGRHRKPSSVLYRELVEGKLQAEVSALGSMSATGGSELLVGQEEVAAARVVGLGRLAGLICLRGGNEGTGGHEL